MDKLDMNLASLADEVAKEADIPQAVAREVVQTTLDVIGRALAEGRNVKIGNFGTFALGWRSLAAGALGGRIGEARQVRVVKFRLNGRLREAVRGGTSFTTLKRPTSR